MDVEVSGLIRAPLALAWAWWTDFGEPGQLFVIDHGVSRTRRRVVAREGDVVLLEERGAGPKPGILLVRHRVTIRAEAHELVEDLLWPTRNRSVWRFEAEGGATRVTRTYPRVGLVRLVPRGVLARYIQRDLDAHVATANAELAQGHQG
ncbi:MAG: hypothetical protein QOE90_3307 [Thermoplasmata archaeon]|jgi:hypothetical protein|nr:hypothetical protein [Thermoplasmata archaeon]